MKKCILTLLLCAVCGLSFAQMQSTTQWNKVFSDRPETFRIQLVSSSENSIKVNVQVPGFFTTTVATPRGEAKIVSMPKAISTAQAGEPNVPMTGIPAIIGDRARMSVRVVDMQFEDFEGVEVAPSKGDFSRQTDPSTVPYTYGDCYNHDAFFPSSNVGLNEPYIVRDFRGQNMVVYPFAYNPVTKTLRVYYNMTVELFRVDDNGDNAFQARRGNEVRLNPDFKNVYQRHFVNYEASMSKYNPLDEDGDLLIICHDGFINAMTDFVNWKKTRGVNTTIVGTSTAGTTSAAIKTFIQNQYNANTNLTHVLLVGDVEQIPGYSYSGGGSYSGYGDNPYGQIVGNDIYNDLFIGRFSAQNVAQVATQVQRTITYERDLTTSATWLKKGEGISKREGGAGHNGEDDYQHIENIRTDLLNFGYNTVYQDYENLSGYTCTAASISNHINSGVGIVNYCNHGSNQLWGVASYSNSNVNALVNENKLPFIWSVACNVGKYDNTSTYNGGGYTVGQANDCFAEAWMHATNSAQTQPTGAIGALMSYISQPWIPPMWAQDECIDILVENHLNNIKHTWGGTSINGIMGIFDHYGTSETQAVGTYQSWILYGDPSLMLRTKTPQAMTVNHSGTIDLAASTYTVNVTNGNGALATITDADHNILGSATIVNGSATINLTEPLIPASELTLCVFGYNKETYLGTISVVGGVQYSITCDTVEHGSISAPELAYAHLTVTLTAYPDEGYCLSAWDVRDADNNSIAVVNNQFTMPESEVTVGATFVEGKKVTLASVMNGSISADPTCALPGTLINMTATPDDSFGFGSWTVFKTGDVNTLVTVNDNSFVMPDFDVTVSAYFQAYSTEDITIGTGNSTNRYIPSYIYYKYTLSEQIYTPSEIGGAGVITAIALRNSNNNTATRLMDIYMKHTTKTSFSSNNDRENLSESQKVFSGSVDFAGSTWTVITLDTPFEYDGTSHLLVGVDDNTGGWISNYPQFYTNTTSTYRSVYIYSDDTNYNPAIASSYTSGYTGRLQAVNQIKLTKMVPVSSESVSVSPTELNSFTYQEGQGPSEVQSFGLIGESLEGDLLVTAPEHFEISASEEGTYSDTLTFSPTNGELLNMVYVRMKSGLPEGDYSNETLTLSRGDITQTVILGGQVTEGFVEQTIELVSGWNWCSFNVDVTLDELKAALVVALPGTAISIKSQTQNTSYNPNNNRWVGSLAWDVAKMYSIKVVAPCEISFEGMPLNPAEHPVNIVNGANWIGFPLNANISLSNAFAGFATNGDRLKSQTNNALYNGIRWQGQLNMLMPGKGYIYISNSTGERIFTFPISTK